MHRESYVGSQNVSMQARKIMDVVLVANECSDSRRISNQEE